jgi:hypothetical protein
VSIETILASAVIAAVVSGIISILLLERRIEIKNITQERTKWREKVRDVSKRIHHAIISRNTTQLSALRSEFQLLVDPTCLRDREILESISMAHDGQEEQRATEFTEHVSLMLKYDWERTKFEAYPFWAKWFKKYPKRKTLLEYEVEKYRKEVKKLRDELAFTIHCAQVKSF